MGGHVLVRGLALLFAVAITVIPAAILANIQGAEAIARVLVINSLAIIPGVILTFVWYWTTCMFIGIDKPFELHLDVSFPIFGPLAGIVERYFFGVAVALDVSGVLTGMIIWTVLKSQSHWQIFTGGPAKSLKYVYAGMFGSLFSMLIATITGCLCHVPR